MRSETGRRVVSARAPSDLRRLVRSCLTAVETAAFWLAIALPAVYGPLLAAGTVGVADPQPAFALVAAHAITVLVGQHHDAG